MELWQYIFLFSTAFAAGLMAFRFQTIPRVQLKNILSFSGAYILGITVLHLLPDVFAGHNHAAGKWILAGFFLQLALEQLSKGIEHGHIHASHAPKWSFALQVMVGLCIHSFLEGIPLSAYPQETLHASHEAPHHFFWGIVLHEIPASFTLTALLLLSGFRKTLVVLCLVIKCAMAPLGAALASVWVVSPEGSIIAMALVIGLFLHIATTILFEADSNQHHNIAWNRLLAIGMGAGLAFLSAI